MGFSVYALDAGATTANEPLQGGGQVVVHRA